MRWVVLLCVAGCVDANSIVCANGKTCPGERACDDIHGTCVQPKQLTLCAPAPDSNGAACRIDANDSEAADGVCDQGVCITEGCGDGYIRGDEQCDWLGDVVPDTANCTDLNFYVSKVPTCTHDCTFDLNSCTARCGDSVLQPEHEICETGSPVTKSCVDYGFGAGVLGCINCGPETEECIAFGWAQEPMQGGVIALHGNADNDVYAILADNSISHFDGTSWSTVDIAGCAIPANTMLSFLWTPEPGTVFAAGNGSSGSSVIRLMGGTCVRWSFTNGRLIQGLWAVSATDAWATAERVDSGGTPDPSSSGVWHFNADVWTEVSWSSQTSTELPYAIRGTGPSDIYVLSNDGSYRHFDGAWSAQTIISGLQDPNSMWGGGAANDFYIAGQDASHLSVMKRTGATWTQVLQPLPFLAASYSNISAGYTVGTHTYVMANTQLPSRNYMFVNDGNGWAQLPIPSGPHTAVFATSTGTLFSAVPSTSRIAVMRASARYDHPAGALSDFLFELVAAGPDNAYAIAGDPSFILEHWDGTTWSTVDPGLVSQPSDVALSPSGTPFAVGEFTGLFVGPSWTNDPGATGTNLSVVDDNEVWILDSLGTDGFGNGIAFRWQSGSTTDEHFSTANGEVMNDIYAASSSSVFLAGGAGPGSAMGAILHWTGGSTWDSMPMPAGVDTLSRFRGRSATDIYAISTTGQLLHFDGAAWSFVQGAAQVNDVWGTKKDLFIATYTGLEHFDGAVWTPVATGSVVGVRNLAGVGDTLLIADYLAGWHELVRLAPWPVAP